jgi:hypothetical protein
VNFTVLPSTVIDDSRANSLTVFGPLSFSPGIARDTPIVAMAINRHAFQVHLDFTDHFQGAVPRFEHHGFSGQLPAEIRVGAHASNDKKITRLALDNITAGVREREDANRTRVAGHLDAIQGVVARMLMVVRSGAVGFIDWLGDLLKIVRELVSRLIQLDVIRAGHDHHDDAAVLALLDRTSELRSFHLQLPDRRIDVVAHQGDRMVTRGIVGLALPLTMRRVHAHLTRPAFKNEPIVIEILCNVLPAEHVTQKRPRRVSIVGVYQRVN